jgi:hypothetical protein
MAVLKMFFLHTNNGNFSKVIQSFLLQFYATCSVKLTTKIFLVPAQIEERFTLENMSMHTHIGFTN